MDKQLVQVEVARCHVSRFNSRKVRSEEHVKGLSDRMVRNGFEQTRALWGVSVDDTVEVFAGGTRLEAARKAGVQVVPVWIHEGISDDEIARLECQDNENDEYHEKVSSLDVWAECHRLNKVEGWTQQRIADCKGWARQTVVLRANLHAHLCEAAKIAVSDGLFDEGHCEAILGVVSDVGHLRSWLTTEQAQAELVSEVLGKHRGSSAGVKPTVKVVRDAAQRWKDFIRAAELALEALDNVGKKALLNGLVSCKARSLAAVEMCRSKALDAVSAAKDDAERQARLSADNAERERLAAQQEAEKGRVLMQFVSKVVLADARNAIETSPDKYHLLLTDPPYGQQFSSGRRVASARKASIANDDPSIAIALLEEVLLKAYSRMADHSNALIFTGWRLEPQFRAAIERAGFEIRGSLVWVKNNHGAGDLSGCFSPKHERIIHAVKGNPKLLVRYPDVLEGKDKQDSLHPTEKPIDLLTRLIEATTEPGQCVVDPFAGSGSTLLAAHKLGRDFWGCEIDPGWHGRIGDALIAILKGEAAA